MAAVQAEAAYAAELAKTIERYWQTHARLCRHRCSRRNRTGASPKRRPEDVLRAPQQHRPSRLFTADRAAEQGRRVIRLPPNPKKMPGSASIEGARRAKDKSRCRPYDEMAE
jgi:hypothetical protein